MELRADVSTDDTLWFCSELSFPSPVYFLLQIFYFFFKCKILS